MQVFELLGGVALYQHVAVVESLEVSLDDVALESSIHMTASLKAAIKELVSHDSENSGNSYRSVGCCAGMVAGIAGMRQVNHSSARIRIYGRRCLTVVTYRR